MSKPENPAKKVAYLVGISPQMLDYLEREGIFERDQIRALDEDVRRKKGLRRDYTFRDIVVLKAIARLLERGVSVRRLRKALLEFARDARFECDRRQIRYDQRAVQFLVTDGTQVYFRSGGGSVTSLLEAGQNAFHFVLDIAEARKAVLDLERPKKAKGA